MNTTKGILVILTGVVSASLCFAAEVKKETGTPSEWATALKSADERLTKVSAFLKGHESYKGDKLASGAAVDKFVVKQDEFHKAVTEFDGVKKTLDDKGKGEHKAETAAVIASGVKAVGVYNEAYKLFVDSMIPITAHMAKTLGEKEHLKLLKNFELSVNAGFKFLTGLIPLAAAIVATF
uniref:Membrane protein, putative n=1 Tax=Babesia bovis TaxID=5865 RepID=S6C816_BABBO|nr:membrane protein, putative [Babesia bovis]